jgi:hypothetical protein
MVAMAAVGLRTASSGSGDVRLQPPVRPATAAR